jgi:hypothetical protein
VHAANVSSHVRPGVGVTGAAVFGGLLAMVAAASTEHEAVRARVRGCCASARLCSC